MALLAAKCTQCGANIEVDRNKEAAICNYCGTVFIVEKTIQNYVLNSPEIANMNIENATINVIYQGNDQATTVKAPNIVDKKVIIEYPKYIKTQIFGLKWKVCKVYYGAEIELANSQLGQSVSIEIEGPTEIVVSGGNAFGKARAFINCGEKYVVKMTMLGTIKLIKTNSMLR